jgi:hypothetical protein
VTEFSIEPFANADLHGLVALVDADGGSEYAVDVERTSRALSAPGVTTLVAIDDGPVVGAIQVQLDGVIQAHVSMLLVDANWEPFGASRSLGFRTTREHLGLRATDSRAAR